MKKISKKYLEEKYLLKQDSGKRLTSLESTIHRSFALRLQISPNYTEDQIIAALKLLGMNPENIVCIYCGNDASLWDHFHSLVKNKTAQLIEADIKGFVPSCDTCNESRGNKNWQDWISRKKQAKTWWGKKQGETKRHKLLTAYEKSFIPKTIDPSQIYGKKQIEEYHKIKNEIVALLKRAEELITKK